MQENKEFNVEETPLWKANHMYLNEEQKQSLRNLLHRVQWDEEYAEKIMFDSEHKSFIFAFDWNCTEEERDYWDDVADQCYKKEVQQDVFELSEDANEETEATNYTSEYFLQRGIDLQQERGKEYDNGQERSMGKIVDVFNIITGKNLSESEGWLFMQILKDVRQWTKPEYHADSAEDCVSYAALKAEALASGK